MTFSRPEFKISPGQSKRSTLTSKRSTRRQLFADCGVGVGKVALASLLAGEISRSASASEVADHQTAKGDRQTAGMHHAPKAKRVIYLFMAGAPSQLDLFDHKPELAKLEGQPIPASVIAGQRYAFIQPNAAVLGPQYKFDKHGESAAEISEMLPHLAGIADEVAFLKGVHTDQFNHAPAQIFVNTGSPLPGRPAMGSWLSYGIGSECEDLPGFIVLKSGGNLSGGAAMWSAGFLPGQHQGVPFRASGDPILNVANPVGIDVKTQRESLDLIASLNQQRLSTVAVDDIQTRMESYEMAFRMQSRAPELMDFSDESEETLNLYGIKENDTGSFGKNCLLARRLAQSGVRFIQLYHAGWDHHSQVKQGLKNQCQQTDQGCAALIKDLKRLGMLDDTLVVWGGEFGRTPMVESSAALGRSLGRDHHPQAFTMWMAGGGVKPGQTIGRTDDLGFHPIEDAVHVHDIQATILHQLGIDHEKFTFTYAGRPFRLTDVHGHVINKLVS